MNKKIFSLNLPIEIIDKLKLLSDRKGLTKAELIRRAIEDYLEKQGVKYNG